ncbi:winged helix-turn-helix transcriptional regulator [Dyadobacter fermentans]|nr:winged helix-turn-helix transcriptional regulator [Dyadobacter fermentans]
MYPVVRSKVEYYLTDFGKSLIPIIGAIGQWGDAYDERLRTLILKNMQP